MGGYIQIIQVAFNATILRERLAKVTDELFDGSAERRRVLALVALQDAQCLVHLHNLFDELVNLLLSDVVVKAILDR